MKYGKNCSKEARLDEGKEPGGMEKRPWLLVVIGAAVLWFGYDIVSKVHRAYETLCYKDSFTAVCPGISGYIELLNGMVVALAICLPLSINAMWNVSEARFGGASDREG